jgi:ABC-type transport system involved in multi-copper enzyme maturation permease subunit
LGYRRNIRRWRGNDFIPPLSCFPELSMSGAMLLALGPPWMATWLTPIWILGVGCVLGIAILLVLWGVTFVVSRPAAAAVPLALQEGPLWPVFLGIMFLAVFGLGGWLFVAAPREILSSVVRYPFVGETFRTYDIPDPQTIAESSPDGQSETYPIDVSINGREVHQVRVRSNQNVDVSLVPEVGVTTPGFHVIAGEEYTWTRSAAVGSVNPFPNEQVDKLYIRNLGSGPAEVQFAVLTRSQHPEAVAAPVMALFVVAIVLLYMAQRAFMPKLSAVALSTAKSEMAQPLFLINLAFGAVLLWLFIFIPYYTLGEDIKMFKNSALTLIMVLCIIQAIWAASNSIAEEIEGRTALTVLSKPLSRWQFILGKYAGILWSTGLVFLFLSAVFLLCLTYKPVYDAKEGGYNPFYSTDKVEGGADVTWQEAHYEMVQTLPGLALAFMETAVLAAVSVAISTRLPMMANFVICFSIYVLGHLTPLMVQSAVVNQAFEPVVFVGRLIATIFPVLENLNIQAAVAGGKEVPVEYLGWAFLYSLIYGVIAMLLALALFEDRDLA